MYLLTIIVTLIQHVYLYYVYNNTENTSKIEKYIYNLYDEQYDLTVYKNGNLQSNKILLILAGSYMMCFDTYVQKILTDLLDIGFIKNNYQIIIIEKLDKTSIMLYEDISKYLLDLDMRLQIEELTILGFSSGGVISSHVMSLLKPLKCKKMIITYDTPYQVLENVLSFEKNILYRIDYYLYSVVYKTYLNHYDYEKIKDFVRYDKIVNSASDFVRMIQQIHNFTDEELYFRTGFNFDQEKETKIINIYCKYDALVNREISMKYIETHRGENNVEHEMINAIGHCSYLHSSNIRILNYLLK